MVLDESLPPNPCIAVAWHALPQKRTAIPSAKLADWHKGVIAIPNPVRRDYLLFVLFTGLRKTSAAEVRWEDVDFKSKVLRVPKPKGGEERAFDLPLSDYLIDLLRRRQRENPELVAIQVVPEDALEWVFPAFSESGHIEEPREKIKGVPFAIHDLRRTFITVAESLDVSPYTIKALISHSQPKNDVTGGYMNLEIERLRGPMQRITDILLRMAEGAGPANVVPLDRMAREQA